MTPINGYVMQIDLFHFKKFETEFILVKFIVYSKRISPNEMSRKSLLQKPTSASDNEFCKRRLLKSQSNWRFYFKAGQIRDKLGRFYNINPTDTGQKVDQCPCQIQCWQWHFPSRQVAVFILFRQIQLLIKLKLTVYTLKLKFSKTYSQIYSYCFGSIVVVIRAQCFEAVVEM